MSRPGGIDGNDEMAANGPVWSRLRKISPPQASPTRIRALTSSAPGLVRTRAYASPAVSGIGLENVPPIVLTPGATAASETLTDPSTSSLGAPDPSVELTESCQSPPAPALLSIFTWMLSATLVVREVNVCASLKPPRAPTDPSCPSGAGGHAAAVGAASSLWIVPMPWPSAIVPFGEVPAR